MEACLNPFFAKTQILVQFYGKALGPSRRNGEVEVAGELEIEVLSLLPCLGRCGKSCTSSDVPARNALGELVPALNVLGELAARCRMGAA
jgi:hypothetical protein